MEGGFYLKGSCPDATAALLCCQQSVVLANYLFPVSFSLSPNLFIHIALSLFWPIKGVLGVTECRHGD